MIVDLLINVDHDQTKGSYEKIGLEEELVCT